MSEHGVGQQPAETQIVMTNDQLRSILDDVLNSRRHVDDDTHEMHHRFIEEMIERSARRRALWDHLTRTALGWAVTTAIAAIAAAVWFWFKANVNNS